MDIKNIMVLLFTSSAVLMLYQNCSEQFEDSGNPKSKEETNYNSEANIDPTSTEESNNNSENIPVVKNTDPGVGSWLPLGTPDRLIADQSGQSVSKVSYVPGCLNGNNIISASASGCGGNSIFEGPIAGSSSLISFAFGAGRTLGLRYISIEGAGSMAKGLTISSGDGGNVGYAMKVWLSTSPTSTFDSTSDACKNNSTTQPYIITGPGYCPITPNTKYYLFMSVDEDASNLRYKVHEGSSDFY